MNNTTFVGDSANVTSLFFEEFVPVLAQCYLIVLAGYLVTRFQLLSAADQRGATAFVSYLGMPGIICVTLSDADLSDFRWELLLSLFLGKLLVFFLVAVVAMGITRNIGVAGVLAVFCVHSNDLPIGNPIISSLYHNCRPEMVKYLFFMPALTMIFFVPMGQYLIEICKNQQSRKKLREKDTTEKQNASKKEFVVVFNSILKAGPVVIATTLGLLFNYIFSTRMHYALHKPLKIIAETVPGMVLSIVGFSFVRKERYLISSAMVPACLLLIVKMFITPILFHKLVRVIAGESPSTKNLSDFCLLYGIVSPATAIFLSGQEFRTPLAAMSAALIFSTLLSFPTSFVVAKFTIVTNLKLIEYESLLKTVTFYIACFSIVCYVFVWISILCKKKGNKFPNYYVICLSFTQIMTCCGVITWYFDLLKDEAFFQAILFCGGEISGYVWTAVAAISMISVGNYHDLHKKKLMIVAFITTSICGVLISGMCLLVSYNSVEEIFFIGLPQDTFQLHQMGITTIILILCLIIIGICLLLYFKRPSPKFYLKKLSWCCYSTISNDPRPFPQSEIMSVNPYKNEFDNPLFYIDVTDVCFTRFKKKRESTASIRSNLNEKEEVEIYYKEINNKRNIPAAKREEWSFKLFSLLLLLFITMFIRLVANLYKITKSKALEIMIPLEFFQMALFIGQGLFFFLTFGINARTISFGVIRWWRKCLHGKDDVVVNISFLEEKEKIILFCNKFSTFYYAECFQKLAKNRKWMDEVYVDCFWGHQLVNWMIEERVAKDDVEAEELGQKLLLGGVIRHVTNFRQFYDAPYLYCFSKKEENGCTND